TAVIVNGTPENRETIADAGLAYDSEGGAHALAPILERLLANPTQRDALARAAAERAAKVYSWEAVTDQYEALLLEMAGTR
ncbi:MAG: glycosyl transferase family 1, partial [Gemmatimonadota bacterium]